MINAVAYNYDFKLKKQELEHHCTENQKRHRQRANARGTQGTDFS